MNERFLSFAMVAVALLGCSPPTADATFAPTLPSQQGFPYVAQLMEHRCGTLDCHGSASRNLRVYGDEGLRLSASDQPCVPPETTTAEVGQDYESIVDLEPESLSTVVANHGADPQSLTLIAKPLGIESHMGGTVFQMGDDTYTCLTSWLAGQTNTETCLGAMPATVCGLPATGSFDAGAD
jgi:hypothetical protein